MVRKKNKNSNSGFNTLNSLDFLLKDLLGQISAIFCESAENGDVIEDNKWFVGGEKDFTRYTKLIELFFKGVDLMEKFNAPKIQDSQPQNNFIEGIEEEKI